MKKRLSLLFASLPLILSSCSGGFSPVGTYEFRLGKTDGSHLEVSATLTNEDHKAKEGAKKMTLSADLGDEFSISKILDEYADTHPLLVDIIEKIKKSIEDIKEIEMYYSLLNIADEKLGNRLAIGSSFLTDFINEKFPEVAAILKQYIGDDSLELSPDKLQYLFTSYVNSKNLTFQIPVSIEDVRMQLVWYGLYIDESYSYVKLPVEKMPGPQGDERFGVHPVVTRDDKGEIVSSEVKTVNDMFEKEFSKTSLYQLNDKNEEVEIGRFSTRVNENNHKTLCLHLLDSYQGATTNIKGYVYSKDLLGEYSEKQNIKLSIGENNVTNVVHNGKSGRDEGFTDEDGNQIKFDSFMVTPFVFRDFHIVKLGLTKI